MRRDDVLAILAAHRDELRETYGVKSLALFGSVARDEAGPASDIDLLVEFDRSIGLFHLFDTQHFLEDLLGRAVDLTPRNSIRPELRDIILAEAINAPREWRLRITDILDAIARIQRYTADLTEDAFVNDERTRDAVIRNLEVIGEASRHVGVPQLDIWSNIARCFPDRRNRKADGIDRFRVLSELLEAHAVDEALDLVDRIEDVVDALLPVPRRHG